MTSNPVINWVMATIREIPDEDAPVTHWLMVIVTGVFLFEALLMMRFQLSRIQIVSTGLFGEAPELAWSLSPLMHRGVGHWITSLIGLIFLGAAVERHWPWRRYIGFLVIAGYVSIAAGAGVLLSFSDDPVAYYGTSGIVFALGGYAFAHHATWSHVRVTRVEWSALFVGVIMLLQILGDVIIGPYFDPHWFNGGHLAGFVIGTVAGRCGWSRCDRRYYDPG